MTKTAISLGSLRECLLDISQPISKRTHAGFYLRTMGTVEAMQVICDAVGMREDSPLMRHELAYILGQMQFKEACPLLASILDDPTDDILVRHESAEALGALGDDAFLPVLQKYANDPAPEISETCNIAIDLIKWKKQGEPVSKGEYLSVDPAPPFSEQKSVEELRRDLMDPSKSLFVRYRAMFSLRDINSDESALALVDGFDASSALFRHEVAYVLGQMQRPVTIDGLERVLRKESEHRMVRHEAAEALGAIGGRRVEDLLKDYEQDSEQVVKESCQVALNNIEYWSEF